MAFKNTSGSGNRLKSENGFTLIDLSIALLVIGILVTPLVQQYRIWLSTSTQELTEDRAQKAQDTIRNYFLTNNRYPCPADPTLGRTDPDYGVELRDFAGTGQCDLTSLAPFTVTSARDADGIGGNDPVYVGMLPFESLGLTPDEAIDAWNNKFTYAVSGLLTNETTYNGTFGGIRLREDSVLRHPSVLNPAASPDASAVCTDTALLTSPPVPSAQAYNPVNNAHYVILSHGMNGNGAFLDRSNAAPVRACDLTAGDAENCNNIANNEATFLYDTCKEGDNGYDDIFVANNITFNSTTFANWNPGTNQQNAGAPVGYYGINNTTPEAELDVLGNVHADIDPADPDELGRLHSNEYCRGNSTNCMEPEAIAGTEPSMRCNVANTAISGIAHNQVRCGLTVNNLNSRLCPASQYVTGFTPGGDVCCSGDATCP